MAEYSFSIVTPLGEKFKDKVTAVSVPGEQGGFGILYNHAPIVSKIKKGIVKITKDNTEVYFSVGFGIIEVNHKNECLLLTDSAQKAESLESAKELVN